MAYAVMMSIEGVIAEDLEDLSLAQMIPEGLMLFHALRETFSLTLSSVEADDDLVVRWLKECGVTPKMWMHLLTGEDDMNADGIRKKHFAWVRRNGDLRYVIDSDPEMARYAIGHGVTPLCCPSPSYARHSFLPTSQEGAAAWDAIVEDVMGQRGLRLLDIRDQDAQDEEIDAS